MSSHAAEVRAVLQTGPEVQLNDVMEAIGQFCVRWDIRLKKLGGGDELEAEGGDYSYVSLREAGLLCFQLFCYMNVGMPDGLDALCDNLNSLVTDEGGVIEIIDLDTSPSNDDAIALRCVGPTETVRKQALIRFAFQRAWDLISPIVPRETMDAAIQMCMESAWEDRRAAV